MEGGDSKRGGNPAHDPGGNAPAIVGIGASAGSVQALQAFFEAVPDKTGAAFVVIVHLDPESRSDLAPILATRTHMPVAQVGATERLQPNHVYVIPPDRGLHITDREIAAAEFDEPRGRRAPIDLFFRSLAEHHGGDFAVILTGAGSDGAVGVRAVKEAGGIILVQDPREAEYPSMPRSAIATGIADFVLPVRELAARLAELLRNREGVSFIDERKVDEELLARILANVRVRTGHDFSKYKRTTVLRRIARRMQVTRTDDLEDYFNRLRDSADEAQALLGDLLISVTTFFRDREAFQALSTQALPQLFAGKQANDTFRAWVPGCATGEEAYSIAMLLAEEASRHEARPAIQVFGSDPDIQALAIAREGRFPAAIEADVSENRLRRFFVREGDHFRVREELRDIVLFASHSLLKDPPFSRMDLISCRNLLIYLDRELQQQVGVTLHYALNPGGFLLLGASETADNPPGLFRIIDRKARIYQSTAHPGDRPRLPPHLVGSIGARDQALGRPANPSTVLADAAMAAADRSFEGGRSADETVRLLTEELQLAQGRLRATREESETANEELRAANEELQSINEEYRATSEELETSKEELQSINEELQTVNSELKLKLEAVSRAHNDLQNLIATTDFGTLFLDPEMRIKLFTERVTDIVSLTPNDQGRPIADFAHQLEYDDLLADARTVLARLSPIRREIRSRNGRWYDIRMRPYRTVEDKIDGVVISFVDMTDRRQVEEALRESARALRQQKRLVDLSREPIFIWDFDDSGIREWNRGCEELYGYAREEALGKRKEALLATGVIGSSFGAMKAKLADEGSWSGEFTQRAKDGRELVVESRLQLESFDGRRLVLESTRNITERKQSEHRQQLMLGELTHRVNNTLALAQSIAHQTMRGSRSIEDFGERFEARLLALARAHSVLTGSEWRGGDLGTLARTELEPYASESPQRFTVEGETVSLSADLVTSIGLVLHELATNAAKYGSLSQLSGRLNVSWQTGHRNNQRLLTIIWREEGGPKVAPPAAAGFGSSLIERSIPNATVTREFRAEGMVCTIELPLPETLDHGLID